MQFPRWRSSRMENGLNNFGWETRGYELCALRATPTAFITPGGGKGSYPPPVRGEPSENHTRPGQNGATSNSRTPFWRTLSRTPGSRAIRGKKYRWSLGHVCTIASSPSGAGWVRENQRGQCNAWRVANRSICAWPKTLQIYFTTSGWSLHSPGLGPCLDRMSAPILRCPGI